MNFTFYGHACFCVETAGKKLLFDPFISGNALAQDIDINAIQADYILVSHGHGDHVADLVTIARNTGAQVIAMVGVAGWAARQGCERVHAMNLGTFKTEFGSVSMVPAAHSSSLPDGSYGGSPAGFVVTTADGSFYYAGDTCLTMDMQLIPRYAKLDFAILPIGGYFTMNADDAVAADMVKTTRVIGVHFDTFPPIKIDHQQAIQTFAAAGKELILPGIGESISI